MKYTNMRELKHETARVMEQVEAGEVVEVRRRSEPIALLVPADQLPLPALPDFKGRLHELYGDSCLVVTGTDLVGELRGQR